MSDSDSFIDEVTDEVRRDRLFALLKRFGWIAILLVILIVGGAAWYEIRGNRTSASTQAFGDAILAALDEKDSDARIKALEAVPTSNADQKALIQMLAGSEAGKADDAAEGSKLLSEVAGDGADPIYGQIAEFKKLLMATDMSAEDRRNAFSQLAAPGSALYLLAQEQIALTYVDEGNPQKAIETLKGITDDANVTAGLRQRASQLIVALGGSTGDKDS
ncbi:hypothetical protein KM176_00305 [Pseudooceanicola sp. CBS1P-1]|uniref:Tetratricopeptide repeat protein n=1 Tax=Pseudooceanicola albus TaxID=2692189 RepID=A0A6L7FZW2_9RHOB|nr:MULTISPECIES: hypothetical protein [Pseudooceanicola]MBT9382287.1 hypothetical protein [Pseudooceanicola endophyticus]MXN16830.1 hypothetical protein [Pseudooceanicola albus]